MPSTISVALTPRVSFCAIAVPTSAIVSTSANITRPVLIVASSVGLRRSASRAGVHAVDDVLVLTIDQRPLQLHGRGQLVVLGCEDLLDQVEALDALHPRHLLVHTLDLALDQVLALLGPAQR